MNQNPPQPKTVIKVDPELAELIPGFLNNRRIDIQQIHSALKDGNYDFIKRLGHIMKGAGAGYGFEKITEIGAFIEAKAEINDREAIRGSVEELVHYLDQLEVIYE